MLKRWRHCLSFTELFHETVNSVFYVATDDACGTGFLVRSDGLVLTNYHVIQGNLYVTLQRHVGPTFNGEVVLADPHRDLAAIQIVDPQECANLTPLPIGTAKTVQVGEEILAIGHPAESAAFSLSRGVVSAVTHLPRVGLPFLQASIAINPGNSGGPLMSVNGVVVGMVTETGLTSDGYRVEGLCRAIPAEALADFIGRVPDLSHGLRDFSYCTACGNLSVNDRYCAHCGSPLGRKESHKETNNLKREASPLAEHSTQHIPCEVCGATNDGSSRYCNHCGVRF